MTVDADEHITFAYFYFDGLKTEPPTVTSTVAFVTVSGLFSCEAHIDYKYQVKLG